jgi:hypothetical protein
MSSSYSIGRDTTVGLAARIIVSLSRGGDTGRIGYNATAGSLETNRSSPPSSAVTSIEGAVGVE